MANSASSFQGRLALVTGGSSGIGLAVARLLAQNGANVRLLARHPDSLEAACRSLDTSAGQKHGYYTVDVAKWSDVQAVIQRLEQEAGVPDLVINSAGIAHPGLVQDIPVEVQHELMDVDYFGTVHTVKALLPAMLERGSGYIVNISSAAGYASGPGYGAYSASKYAVRAFSEALRAELKPLGLRVSVVFPPNVDTPQRAYEKSVQTPEIRIFDEESMGLGPWKFTELPASRVAEEILKGVQRGRFIIVIGTGNRVMYRLAGTGVLGNLTYSIVDDEWKDARRKARKR
jgi:3-dehydrosphinganine reductase